MNRLLASTFIVLASSLAFCDGFLVIPNSYTDSILSFDPADGSVLNNHLIESTLPEGGTSGSATILNAIDSTRGTLFCLDQGRSSVFEFAYDGRYLGTVVDGTFAGLSNIRGGEVHDGKLYLTTLAGTVPRSIQRFNLDGSGQETWAVLPTGTSPFDICFRGSDALVSESGLDNIYRVDLATKTVTVWYDSDGTTDINFPEQIHIDPLMTNGVLVAGFSLPYTGVYRFQGTTTGTKTDYWTLPLSIGSRGAYRLDDGNIIWSSGTEVQVLDPGSGVSTPAYGNLGGDRNFNNFRYIERIPGKLLRGNASFPDFAGSFAPFTFQFELRDSNGAVLASWSQPLGPNQVFAKLLPLSVPNGTATLWMQGGHWLSKTATVTIGPTGGEVVDITPVNGDIDRDNSITVFDYGVLSDYFDRSSNDADWSTVGGNGSAPKDADLDGDDTVSVFDYGILSDNFDKSGE